MKITLESTEKVVPLEQGGEARIWHGTTEAGVPVVCFIASVVPANDLCPAAYQQFEEELVHKGDVPARFAALDLRHVI